MRGRRPKADPLLHPPGTLKRRFVPKFHYELIVCGLRGHVLAGTDAESVRPEDAPIVREHDGLRWYRCLRCDAWLPLPLPVRVKRPFPPGREELELPRRGRALRDTIVLRLIAVDRAIHFVVLGALAVLAFSLASHRSSIRRLVDRLNSFFYGTNTGSKPHGFIHTVEHLITLDTTTMRLIGLAAGAYAVLEGAEAYGLWRQRRWAEYLTFVATTLFVPYEIYDLSKGVTVIRAGAFAINLAILVYLLIAKRLFGLRGGAEADHAARQRDSGWEAFDRLTPGRFVSD